MALKVAERENVKSKLEKIKADEVDADKPAKLKKLIKDMCETQELLDARLDTIEKKLGIQ